MALDIPQHRLMSFTRSVAPRFAQGKSTENVQQAIADEQKALAVLLKRESVANAATLSLHKALNALLPPEHQVSMEMVRMSVDAILGNRAADAQQFAQMILQPELLNLVQSLEGKSAPAQPTLTPKKQQEIIDRLVQKLDARGAEPPIHVLASAIGHRITHEALQTMFAPHGKLYHALYDGLRELMPQRTETECTQIAQSWLTARKNAAIAVTDTLKADGAAFTQAMTESAAIVAVKHAAPMNSVSPVVAATMAGAATIAFTPQQIEHAKTREQKGEDIAYTINHALACTATDFIDPYVGNWTQKKFGKRISIDAIEGGHDAKEDTKGHGLSWWIGEATGDFGAIPVTIAFQRLFPGFMHGIRNVMEPSLAGVFMHGAEKAAARFASAQGLAMDDPRVKAKQAEIYKYEVDHLPQAFMWTTSSIAINLATQKYVMKNDAPLWLMGLGKGLGATISATVLVAARGLFPDMAHNSDSWLSRHVIAPTSRVLGGAFGVDDKTLDRAAGIHAMPTQNAWQGRVKESPDMTKTIARAS